MEMLKILSAIIYYVELVIVVAVVHKFMWFLCVDIIIKVAYAGGSQRATKGKNEKPCPTIFRLHLLATFRFGIQRLRMELEFGLESALQLHLILS